jgi:hypothetical protein
MSNIKSRAMNIPIHYGSVYIIQDSDKHKSNYFALYIFFIQIIKKELWKGTHANCVNKYLLIGLSRKHECETAFLVESKCEKNQSQDYTCLAYFGPPAIIDYMKWI